MHRLGSRSTRGAQAPGRLRARQAIFFSLFLLVGAAQNAGELIDTFGASGVSLLSPPGVSPGFASLEVAGTFFLPSPSPHLAVFGNVAGGVQTAFFFCVDPSSGALVGTTPARTSSTNQKWNAGFFYTSPSTGEHKYMLVGHDGNPAPVVLHRNAGPTGTILQLGWSAANLQIVAARLVGTSIYFATGSIDARANSRNQFGVRRYFEDTMMSDGSYATTHTAPYAWFEVLGAVALDDGTQFIYGGADGSAEAFPKTEIGALAKVLNTGNVDPSFGNAGWYTDDYPLTARFTAVAPYPLGLIVVITGDPGGGYERPGLRFRSTADGASVRAGANLGGNEEEYFRDALYDPAHNMLVMAGSSDQDMLPQRFTMERWDVGTSLEGDPSFGNTATWGQAAWVLGASVSRAKAFVVDPTDGNYLTVGDYGPAGGSQQVAIVKVHSVAVTAAPTTASPTTAAPTTAAPTTAVPTTAAPTTAAPTTAAPTSAAPTTAAPTTAAPTTTTPTTAAPATPGPTAQSQQETVPAVPLGDLEIIGDVVFLQPVVTLNSSVSINATGTAQLWGVLNIVVDDDAPIERTIEVVSAQGGVLGQFTAVSASAATLRECEALVATPEYTATSVSVSLTVDDSGCGLGPGAIAGIVVGVVAVACLAVALPLGIKRYREKAAVKRTLAKVGSKS